MHVQDFNFFNERKKKSTKIKEFFDYFYYPVLYFEAGFLPNSISLKIKIRENLDWGSQV